MKISEPYIERRLLNLGLNVSDIISLDLFGRYNEPQRFYHTWNHIEDLFQQANDRGILTNDAIFLAILFHDAIYDPSANDNEEQSAKLFSDIYNQDQYLKEEVVRIILETKTHQPTSELSKVFCEMDLNILRQPIDKLIEYENQIFKEFQLYDWKVYQAGRIAVLKSLASKHNINLDFLINYVSMRKPNIAIYPGSFNPVHKGHINILEKAEQIFDKVIIARGKNPEKQGSSFDIPERMAFHQIEHYDGLLTDFLEKKLEYEVTIIRGLRNSKDFQYELEKYRYMQDMKPNVKVVSLFCDKEYDHISSSDIRYLLSMGKDKEANKYLVK